MAPGRRSILALPLLALGACALPEAGEHRATAAAPIVGGIDDTFRSYVVGVGAPYDPAHPDAPGSGPFCSGALISRRTVLTAGHCVTPGMGPAGGLTAVFFGPDITYPLKAGATVVSTVQAVTHPGFDPGTLTNDLALIELASDAPSQAVPLLRETMTNSLEFVGPHFAFAGYGNDGDQHYGIRRVAVFPIAAVGPACVGLDTGTGPIDATELYYRVPSQNTCDGDSGGPALVPRHHVERLAGSTSAGDVSCLVDGDDARTDLPQIEAFIQPTIDLFEQMDPCRADGVCNESCNTGNQLVDPDCAPEHCGADGICALSCVDPADPDCPAADHCKLDGVCDPTCAPADPDCLPPPSGSPDAGAGTCGKGGAGGAGGGGSAGGSGGTTVAAPDGGADAGPGGGDDDDDLGCGCTVPGRWSAGVSPADRADRRRPAGRGAGGSPRGRLSLGAILVLLGVALRRSRRWPGSRRQE